jgi:hypothetical protein
MSWLTAIFPEDDRIIECVRALNQAALKAATMTHLPETLSAGKALPLPWVEVDGTGRIGHGGYPFLVYQASGSRTLTERNSGCPP